MVATLNILEFDILSPPRMKSAHYLQKHWLTSSQRRRWWTNHRFQPHHGQPTPCHHRSFRVQRWKQEGSLNRDTRTQNSLQSNLWWSPNFNKSYASKNDLRNLPWSVLWAYLSFHHGRVCSEPQHSASQSSSPVNSHNSKIVEITFNYLSYPTYCHLT